MPSFEINPQITVNPNTQPKLPSAGSKVTVYYTLTNLEGGTVPQGQIVITDSSGEILGTDSSPKITSGSIDHSTVVNWPSGENVKVSVAWYVGGKSVSDDVLVNSEKVDLEEEEFEIPWEEFLEDYLWGWFSYSQSESRILQAEKRKRNRQNLPKRVVVRRKKSKLDVQHVTVGCVFLEHTQEQ